MIDILSGPLAGAAYGDKVRGSADTTEDCTKGDFYLAIDISQFRQLDDYLNEVEELVEIIRSSGGEVLVPGEMEDRRSAAAGGIVTLDNDMAHQLASIGERFQVQPPSNLRNAR
jgi:L-2-hydroxycarboxylate dehydrogenase (NAD+)